MKTWNPGDNPAPKQVFPDFPYNKRFTKAELVDIMTRADLLGKAMQDGVGPSSAVMNIPADIFEQWMIHAAMAGCTVDDDLAYIRARPVADAMFQGAREWILKKDDTPKKRAEDAKIEADRIRARLETEVSPAVRAEIVKGFMRAAEAAKTEKDDGALGSFDPYAGSEDFQRMVQDYRVEAGVEPADAAGGPGADNDDHDEGTNR